MSYVLMLMTGQPSRYFSLQYCTGGRVASEAGAVAGCRDAFLSNVQLNELMARSDEERSRFAEHDQHMAEQESQAWHRCAP